MTVLMVRKWYDKKNGNTYHSVRGIRPRVSESRRDMSSGITYGYGDSWVETWQRVTGESLNAIRQSMRDFPQEWIIDIVDVSRKGDLLR